MGFIDAHMKINFLDLFFSLLPQNGPFRKHRAGYYVKIF